MQEKIKSEGKCLFCSKTFAKAGIHRHLAKHLREKEKSSEPGNSFFVKVETGKRWKNSPYFLSLWIDGEAELKDLDDFLRDIWLECCGHLSSFTDPGGKTYDFCEDEEEEEVDERDDNDDADLLFNKLFEFDDEDGIPKYLKTKILFFKGFVMEYEYDFGSTTELKITVIEEYSMKADEDIVLLSRNEPLISMCTKCGKMPANQICAVCMYNEYAIFCESCAKKHAKKCEDFADGASLPIVNSPRMGVCGYTGGIIDTERDCVC